MIDDVADLSRRKQYTATEDETVFAYTFPIFGENDLDVYSNNTLLTVNSGYTVSGVGNDTGGNITLTAAAAAGAIITIVGDTEIARSTDYQQNGPWTAARINAEMDKLLAIAQELRAKINRAVRGTTREGVVAEMPSIASRASKFLFWDAFGNPTALTGSPSQPSTKVDLINYPLEGATVVTLAQNYTPGAGQITVTVNGVVQIPLVDFTESSVSTITFAEPLYGGDVVYTLLGIVCDGEVQASYKTVQIVTAVDGQTAINTNRVYVPGNDEIEVILNGSWLTGGGVDYIESNPSLVTMTAALAGNDTVKIVYGQTFDVVDTVIETEYATTAAETAAGVSPTNLFREPGDPRRYGATGDGVTDDSQGIQRAYTVAAYSGFVRFRSANLGARTVYRAYNIDVPSYCKTTADEGVLVRKALGSFGTHIWSAEGIVGAPTTLTANVAKGASSVLVTSAASLAAGQSVVLRDATYAYGATGRNQEMNEILSVVGLTVTLKHKTIRSYATASTAQLVPMATQKRGIVFDGVEFELPIGMRGGGIYFDYAYDCHVINCRGTGSNDQANVLFYRSGHCDITGGTYADGQDQATTGYGRGVAFLLSCNNCWAYSVKTRNVRENSIGQGARQCGFANCEDSSAYSNSYNTDGQGNEDCYIQGNTSSGSRSEGILAFGSFLGGGDKRIHVIGNRVYNAGTHGISNENDPAYPTIYVTIQDNFVSGFGLRSAVSYGIKSDYSSRTRILNNTITGGSVNCAASIRLRNASDVMVRGNECANNSAGYGIVHENCTGGRIEFNDIRDIDATKAGIFAAGFASLETYITNNTVDNDVRFTNAVGPIYRDNAYATKFDVSRGMASIADGGTITHNLIAAPTQVLVSTITTGEFASVTTKGATTFAVAIKTHANLAGTTQNISWEARV